MAMPYEALILRLAEIGSRYPSAPTLWQVTPLQGFFKEPGRLNDAALDRRDGTCTGRELLARFLVLNAVLDQGPDLEGVRELLARVTNELYLQEVRFLHRPLAFFQELGLGIDSILESHQSIKHLRAEVWARANQSDPGRYNLFLDNTTQALAYAVYRWGVPLALPLLLERDADSDEDKPEALVRYIESYPSAEKMSNELKDHERYGLGKAIGDKACHLFAKWYVSSFRLVRRAEKPWGPFSFEVPFDSNAGRVLWRTGFLLQWASEDRYTTRQVIQPAAGKGGKHYIRVTNIRGMTTSETVPSPLWERYVELCCQHLRTHAKGPKAAEIQRLPIAILFATSPTGPGGAEMDDGLIHVGTHYCFNHSEPKCTHCPLADVCRANQTDRRLIEEYRT